MSPRFVLGREKVPCVAEVVNRSLKADCTDFTRILSQKDVILLDNGKTGFFRFIRVGDAANILKLCYII